MKRTRTKVTSEVAFSYPSSLSWEASQSRPLSLHFQPSRPTLGIQAEKILTSRFRSILVQLFPTNRDNRPPGTKIPAQEPELPSGLAQASGNINISGRRRGLSLSNHRERKKSESGRTAMAALADSRFCLFSSLLTWPMPVRRVVPGAKAGRSKRLLRQERRRVTCPVLFN